MHKNVIFYLSINLNMFWVLIRTVSGSTYNIMFGLINNKPYFLLHTINWRFAIIELIVFLKLLMIGKQ